MLILRRRVGRHLVKICLVRTPHRTASMAAFKTRPLSWLERPRSTSRCPREPPATLSHRDERHLGGCPDLRIVVGHSQPAQETLHFRSVRIARIEIASGPAPASIQATLHFTSTAGIVSVGQALKVVMQDGMPPRISAQGMLASINTNLYGHPGNITAFSDPPGVPAGLGPHTSIISCEYRCIRRAGIAQTRKHTKHTKQGG